MARSCLSFLFFFFFFKYTIVIFSLSLSLSLSLFLVVFYFSFTAYLTPRRPRRPVSVVGRPRTPSHRSSLDSVVFHWFSVSKGGGVTAVGPVCRRRGRGHRPGIPRYSDFGDERQRDREREREREKLARNKRTTKEEEHVVEAEPVGFFCFGVGVASQGQEERRRGVAAPLRPVPPRQEPPQVVPLFRGFFQGFFTVFWSALRGSCWVGLGFT